MAKGDDALVDAIHFYTKWVSDIVTSGQPVPQDEWERPLFTYMMTKRQLNKLNAICHAKAYGYRHVC